MLTYKYQIFFANHRGREGGGTKNCIPRNGQTVCNIKMDLGEGANYIPRIDLNLVLIVVF